MILNCIDNALKFLLQSVSGDEIFDINLRLQTKRTIQRIKSAGIKFASHIVSPMFITPTMLNVTKEHHLLKKFSLNCYIS